MSAVILELNDSGLLAQANGKRVLESPGFATVLGNRSWVGADALAQFKLNPTATECQFWDRLGMDALGQPNALATTQADLAFQHLSKVWGELKKDCQDLILVVPGDWNKEQLGLLLGMSRKLEMPVRALIDTAIATSVAPVPGRQLFHLDVHLHRCVLSQLSQGAWLEREQVLSSREVGLARFRDAWTHTVAGLLVQATRFDPMHHANTEQWLYDRLEQWCRHLDEHEHVDIDLPHEDRMHSVKLHRRQLLKACEPLLRRLREFIADALPDNQPVVLQLSHRLAELPGAVQTLETMPGLELVLMDEMAPGNGVGRLYLGRDKAGSQVPYVTKVPWFNAGDLDAHGDRLAGYERVVPTHLLHQATAYALRNGSFSVGTDPQSGVRLDPHLPGVAGEHFRLLRDGDRVLLEDLSEGNTAINDELVSQTVAVAAGDRIRVGSPGTEFLLIAVEDSDGA
jgi:hypothetical protein